MDCGFFYFDELVTYYAVTCLVSLGNLTRWSCGDATLDVLLLTCYLRGCNSNSCTTTKLSVLLTSRLTAIKNHVITIPQQFMKGMVNLFWSIKKSGEILNKLNSRGFLASSLSTYDYSTH